MFKLLKGMKGPICVLGSVLLNCCGPARPGPARTPGGGGFAHCKDEWRCGVTAGKVPMETAASQKSPLPPSGWARMFGSFQTVSV